MNDRMEIWETEQSLCFVTTHRHPGIIIRHPGITLNLGAKGLLLHPDSTNSYYFFRAQTLPLAPRSTK